ncbi:NF-kappa-B essential modulator isoform X1 [Conger conger]|uniref:NF-kappa-B essential modulator isoform X1 n=1 Tax=Conger conger TaxID=82655 RepID=UPI002A59E102|nr:NF-kappa-B essential modulator isoform X1 [Conger conger]
MVQPQARVETGLQLEMTGGGDVLAAGGQGSLGASSQGSLRVPPELASNEIVHRLLGDNHQLREALRRSNVALRERCEEMEGWQRRMREEREFLGSRFREARDLVERLSLDNKSLQTQLNHRGANPPTHGPDAELGGTEPQGEEPQNQPGATAGKTEAESKEARERESQNTPPRSLPSEGGNEFLQLLKSHKEKLEEGMRELRRKNEELEKERDEAEREKESLRCKNAQLQAKLEGCSVTEETAQRSAAHPSGSDSSTLARLTEQLQATQCRYRELQEKLDCLQKTTVHRDRTDALLKQREKEYAQLVKDSEALKAQVTSLLGELNERQSSLEKSEKERKQVDEKLTVCSEDLHSAQRQMDQLKKQHSVAVDKLRLQTQNLEAALRTERLVLTEEKRKLAQLQHAYTQLFKDYDTKRKNGGEVEDLGNRLVEAERALALKQELIDKLKEEVDQQRGSLETVPVLTAQAEIYKADFRAEREAREKLHQRKEELQEQLTQALAELDRVKLLDSTRAKIEVLQQRHVVDEGQFRTHPRLPPPSAFLGATVPFSPAQASSFPRHSGPEEQPDFRCPKCQYQAPDMDTLQIHVMDCIQ